MLKEIQQVLRLVMLLGKHRQHPYFKGTGGLLVLLWTETEASVPSINCTVAAAGPWCTGIKIKALQPVLRDLKERMFPSSWSCPLPDPEELGAFTDLYGSHKILLSFQMKDERLSPEWCARIETFLHTFSLVNAKIKIHLKFKFSQQIFQRDFRVKMTSKVSWANQPALILDVTSSVRPPECVKKGCWCRGGHPVLGGRLPLSIPPEVMDQGLFGELSIQLVMLLSPCVLQYPNLATQLTHIQTSFPVRTGMVCIVEADGKVSTSNLRPWCCAGKWCIAYFTLEVLVCGPSNVPFTGPSTFFQNLPSHLDCQELGLHGLHCSSSKDLVHSGGTVYTVEQENNEDPEQETVQQGLLLFLSLQHSDPFTCQLSDMMATEMLIERHLEDVLSNNRQAVTSAVQTGLQNTLSVHNHRKKDQEKLRSAAEVILSSTISIVSCSSNMDFRNTCLSRMKVRDTYELSASLRESLRRVTSWKFTPRGRCYSAQVEEHPESDDEPTRTEI